MTKHDDAAQRLAARLGVEYNRGQGPDVITGSQATETETSATVADAARQLAGFTRSVYVQGADKAATDKALTHYKDTTIGVRDPTGKILKPSTRKSRRK
ncbi:MAG: hypothetical protein IH989_03750 [Planctomycetes bacterium]|nr:hypothetical protein [Planctomycetota bacterium]